MYYSITQYQIHNLYSKIDPDSAEWDAYNYQINVGGEVDGFIFGQRDQMKKYFEGK